jgi:hypothetical protein
LLVSCCSFLFLNIFPVFLTPSPSIWSQF